MISAFALTLQYGPARAITNNPAALAASNSLWMSFAGESKSKTPFDGEWYDQKK
jgi:hypothetical protein